jgi:hypothetical protein
MMSQVYRYHCKPMTPEQIEHGVKYATDADYRADYLKERFNEQLRINRGLRADLLARSACDGEGEAIESLALAVSDGTIIKPGM